GRRRRRARSRRHLPGLPHGDPAADLQRDRARRLPGPPAVPALPAVPLHDRAHRRRTAAAVAAAPLGSNAVALLPLLVFLAADAQARLGAGLEALHRDLFLARLAGAEASVLDLLEGAVDLVEERLLAATQAERERLLVLARREVHLVGQVVRVEG